MQVNYNFGRLRQGPRGLPGLMRKLKGCYAALPKNPTMRQLVERDRLVERDSMRRVSADRYNLLLLERTRLPDEFVQTATKFT